MKFMRRVKRYLFILIFLIFLLFIARTVNCANSLSYLYVKENFTLLSIECDLGEEYDDLVYYDRKDNVIKDYDSIVKTGLKVKSDMSKVQYNMVVRGDIDGDGDIDLDDQKMLKSQIIELTRFKK